jgi:spore photoproduct lyase
MGPAIFSPERLFVERSVRDLPVTRRLLELWPSVPRLTVDSARQAAQAISAEDDPVGAGKRRLLIARQRGPFIKRCPGTSGYICCGYRIINAATGCDLDCSYCILQGYLTNPLLTVYANTDDLLAQLETFLSSGEDKFYRCGTGELTDSLSLDPAFGHGRLLVPFFAGRTNAILELKTKTTRIEQLLELDHGGRTVVSWSLNAEQVARREEHGAPPVIERLQAARRCQEAGYRIGFHFDPVIEYPGWETGYRRVVDAIFEQVEAASIAWISLGALRYPPALEEIIRRRHPASEITLGELFPGKDGKPRYFRPIRTRLFKTIHDRIKEHDRDVFVYLCMESDRVWRQALGWSPGSMKTLSGLLDERVKP